MKTNRPFNSSRTNFIASWRNFISFLATAFEHECIYRERDIKRIVKIWSRGVVDFKFRYPDEEQPVKCIKCGKELGK